MTVVISGNATAAPVMSATFSLNMLLLSSRVLFHVNGSGVKPVCACACVCMCGGVSVNVRLGWHASIVYNMHGTGIKTYCNCVRYNLYYYVVQIG